MNGSSSDSTFFRMDFKLRSLQATVLPMLASFTKSERGIVGAILEAGKAGEGK